MVHLEQWVEMPFGGGRWRIVNEMSPRIVAKGSGSAERGYRDSRRSLVEEGGAPEGVSSLSHFARQHVEPWRADWGGVTRQGDG